MAIPGNRATPPPAVAPDLADLTGLAAAARLLPLRPPFRAVTEQSGPHQSRFRGRGLEFSELREYQVGDDLRDIDWRSTARTGSAHIRCYQAERERTLWLIVDQRGGMRFGSRRCFKSVAAARCAALLGWAGTGAGDRVGGLVLKDTGVDEFRPQRNRASLLRLLGSLCEEHPRQATGDGRPGLMTALTHSAMLLRPGALVFVVSDLHDLDEGAALALRRLQRRHDVIAIRVTDDLDHALPPAGWYAYLADGQRVRVHTGNPQLRAEFQRRVAARESALHGLSRRARLPLVELRTQHDPLPVLRQQLGGRQS